MKRLCSMFVALAAFALGNAAQAQVPVQSAPEVTANTTVFEYMVNSAIANPNWSDDLKVKVLEFYVSEAASDHRSIWSALVVLKYQLSLRCQAEYEARISSCWQQYPSGSQGFQFMDCCRVAFEQWQLCNHPQPKLMGPRPPGWWTYKSFTCYWNYQRDVATCVRDNPNPEDYHKLNKCLIKAGRTYYDCTYVPLTFPRFR